MARRPRPKKIDTPTARLALKVQGKPQGWSSIAPGVRVAYRRNKRAGRFVLATAIGEGRERLQNIPGVADDYEKADGEHVITFYQAVEKGRAMARGTSASGAVATWGSALDDYAADLQARGQDVSNARRVRHHTPTTLMETPLPQLTGTGLRKWRNGLFATLKAATAKRTLKAARAMLNAAADHDSKRIPERPWKIAFAKLIDHYEPVDRVQPDSVVLALVAAAYAHDETFGLFTQIAAETGARASQIAKLLVADLQADVRMCENPQPKLLMPSSLKGKNRKVTRRPIPISLDLADKLERAAGKRAPGEPLLLRGDGTAWNPKKQDHLQIPFAEVAARVGIDETMYCLRHSAIVRALLANVPARLVAANADTSLAILERVYSRFVGHYGDELARRGLLSAATSDNVVSLAGRR
jgi:integrase